MGRDILVDGYNIIKNSASFRAVEMRNFSSARDALINLLVQRYRHTPHRVFVVFDGDSAIEQRQHDRHICIIYSRHNQTADSVIARLATTARAEGREVEIYSDDQEVQQSVARQDGSALPTVQLTKHLNEAPADLARLSHHRQRVRHQYGLDPVRKYDQDDDEYQSPSSHDRKKKKVSRHKR